jgi:hypothetical protein
VSAGLLRSTPEWGAPKAPLERRLAKRTPHDEAANIVAKSQPLRDLFSHGVAARRFERGRWFIRVRDDAATAKEVDYDQIVRESTEKLRGKFPDRPESELRSVVEEELAKLPDSTVQDYLSVLTLRAARKRVKNDADAG